MEEQDGTQGSVYVVLDRVAAKLSTFFVGTGLEAAFEAAHPAREWVSVTVAARGVVFTHGDHLRNMVVFDPRNQAAEKDTEQDREQALAPVLVALQRPSGYEGVPAQEVAAGAMEESNSVRYAIVSDNGQEIVIALEVADGGRAKDPRSVATHAIRALWPEWRLVDTP